MPIDIDLSQLGSAAIGVIAGAAVASVGLFVLHRRRLKAERSQKHTDRPLCLYSTTALLSAGIVRIGRGRQ